MKIKGVIFDLDGLLLDTEKLYQRFWIEAAAKCGYKMTKEQSLQLRSLDKELAKELLSEWFGKDFSYQKTKDIRVKLMNEYIDQNGIEAKKGAKELAEYLREKSYKTAIATATNYERANCHLKLAGIRQYFDNVICASSVEHGKPFPDVYLYACRQLQLEPCECLALEDSPNGIKSAYSAGCVTVCVPDNGDIDEGINPLINYHVKSLNDVVEIIENMN